MAIIFGVMQMMTAMDYWTNEYWDYAKAIEKEQNKLEAEKAQEEKHGNQN